MAEGRGFESRFGHRIFQLIYSFHPQHGLGIDSASNRNGYQKIFLSDKERAACKADNLIAICEPIV
jgi:hypothetical protein